jgi:hypothetical protein
MDPTTHHVEIEVTHMRSRDLPAHREQELRLRIGNKTKAFLSTRGIIEPEGAAFQPFLFDGGQVSAVSRRSARRADGRWVHRVHVLVEEL